MDNTAASQTGRSSTLDESRPAPRTADPLPNSPTRYGKSVTCNICCNDGEQVYIPAYERVTPACAQDRTICAECLKRHIKQALASQDYDNVHCICTATRCRARLDARLIQKYADKETFDAYNEVVSRRLVEKDPEFCWCSNERCGSGQFHVDLCKPALIRCHACRFVTCFTHRCAWHRGRTCEEYDRDAGRSEEEVALLPLMKLSPTHHCAWHRGRTCEEYDRDARRRKEEVAMLQLLKNWPEKFKQCPRCQNGVEKNEGCDHMTCRCKHQFCWLCLAPYGGATGIHAVGNSAHQKTCPHYRVPPSSQN
jgi:hypothetical protein